MTGAHRGLGPARAAVAALAVSALLTACSVERDPAGRAVDWGSDIAAYLHADPTRCPKPDKVLDRRDNPDGWGAWTTFSVSSESSATAVVNDCLKAGVHYDASRWELGNDGLPYFQTWRPGLATYPNGPHGPGDSGLQLSERFPVAHDHLERDIQLTRTSAGATYRVDVWILTGSW